MSEENQGQLVAEGEPEEGNESPEQVEAPEEAPQEEAPEEGVPEEERAANNLEVEDESHANQGPEEPELSEQQPETIEPTIVESDNLGEAPGEEPPEKKEKLSAKEETQIKKGKKPVVGKKNDLKKPVVSSSPVNQRSCKGVIGIG